MQMGLPLVAPAPQPAAPPVVRGTQPSGPPASERYFIRHRRARRYILRLEPDGRLRVTIPRGGSKREAAAFADRHDWWVERQRAKMRAVTRFDGDRDATRALAAKVLPSVLLAWAAKLDLDVVLVSVRDQRTRWGSCGRNGRICLNWRLVLMPDWVRDYVIVHELMHLRRMDHSRQFWRYVADAYPRWREARGWLRANGAGLR
jgi:predicted metal-dependent hydrolase